MVLWKCQLNVVVMGLLDTSGPPVGLPDEVGIATS